MLYNIYNCSLITAIVVHNNTLPMAKSIFWIRNILCISVFLFIYSYPLMEHMLTFNTVSFQTPCQFLCWGFVLRITTHVRICPGRSHLGKGKLSTWQVPVITVQIITFINTLRHTNGCKYLTIGCIYLVIILCTTTNSNFDLQPSEYINLMNI